MEKQTGPPFGVNLKNTLKLFKNKINIGLELYNNDLLSTGSDGFIMFAYLDDGSIVKVYKDSKVYVTGDLKNKKSKRYKIFSLIESGDSSQVSFLEPTFSPSSYVIKCEDFGIPQARHRVILLGIRSDLNITPQSLKKNSEKVFSITPDIITTAKGITSGYMPLGALIISDRLMEEVRKESTLLFHGFTYSGHPACCAAALKNIEIIQGKSNFGNSGGFRRKR